SWRTSRGRSAPVATPSPPRRRLPQLEPIALRVGGPAETAVWPVVDAFIDVRACPAELRQHRVQILHPVVDHVCAREVVGLSCERRPDGGARLAPRESVATPGRVYFDAEVVAVPCAQ